MANIEDMKYIENLWLMLSSSRKVLMEYAASSPLIATAHANIYKTIPEIIKCIKTVDLPKEKSVWMKVSVAL